MADSLVIGVEEDCGSKEHRCRGTSDSCWFPCLCHKEFLCIGHVFAHDSLGEQSNWYLHTNWSLLCGTWRIHGWYALFQILIFCRSFLQLGYSLLFNHQSGRQRVWAMLETPYSSGAHRGDQGMQRRHSIIFNRLLPLQISNRWVLADMEVPAPVCLFQ